MKITKLFFHNSDYQYTNELKIHEKFIFMMKFYYIFLEIYLGKEEKILNQIKNTLNINFDH